MTTIVLVDVPGALAASLATATTRAWYPTKVAADAAAPFGIVNMIFGALHRSLDTVHGSMSIVVQLTATGKTAEDVAWLLDAARAHFDTLVMPFAVSAVTTVSGLVVDGPPTAPVEEGSLISQTEDYRLLVGKV